jgi:YfiH family protein
MVFAGHSSNGAGWGHPINQLILHCHPSKLGKLTAPTPDYGRAIWNHECLVCLPLPPGVDGRDSRLACCKIDEGRGQYGQAIALNLGNHSLEWYTELMPFRRKNSLRIYHFECFRHQPLLHAIITRRGGVSPEPWQSLNVGGTVGDEPFRVKENLRRVFSAFGREPESKHDVWQIHSARVQIAHSPRGNTPPIQADIIITHSPEVTLLMRFADCVPVMLYDPRQHVIALIHAGWQGLGKKAPIAAIEALGEEYGSKAEDLIAAVGPSICVQCYPVGNEVASKLRAALGTFVEKHLHWHDDRCHFDLWSCSRDMLIHAGVQQIEMAQICTAMNPEDWYSHRGERGRTGRFAALMALEK